MDYADFSIRFTPGSAGVFALHVRSPQGEGRGELELPRGLDSRSFQGPLQSGRREQIGTALFRALFAGEVGNLFHASLGGLPDKQHGLRIQLEIDLRDRALAPLQDLPWELLYHPEKRDFLCLSRQTPVVRSIDAPRERQRSATQTVPLRVLVLIANPLGRAPLNLERERENLAAAWKGQEEAVEIVFQERGGLEKLRQAFLERPFHVLHFMGHGEIDGESGRGLLLFERENRSAQPVDGSDLAQQLKDFDSLRIVTLNACHTAEELPGADPFQGTATALVQGGVPAVVAMRGPVSDLAAIAFSRTFYRRLAAGDLVEAAVAEARLAVHGHPRASPDWPIPVLFLRAAPAAHRDSALPAARSRRSRLAAGLALLALLGLLAGLGILGRQSYRRSSALRLNNQGFALMQNGQPDQARTVLLEALKRAPENAAIHSNLSALAHRRGDARQALEHARAAARAEPGQLVYAYNLGNLLARQGLYEEAIPILQRVIAADRHYAQAYNELGRAFLGLSRPADARQVFAMGIAQEPEFAPLHKNLAVLLLDGGQIAQAIEHLQTALRHYPPGEVRGLAETRYQLARAEAAAHHNAAACQELRSLQSLDPAGLSEPAPAAKTLAQELRCDPWP